MLFRFRHWKGLTDSPLDRYKGQPPVQYGFFRSAQIAMINNKALVAYIQIGRSRNKKNGTRSIKYKHALYNVKD